jgi:hypothetical protein
MPARTESKKAAKEQQPQEYIVKHTMVDDWAEGTRLTAEQLEGIDIARLLDVGAIAPADAEDEETEPGEAVEPPSEPLPN